MHLGTYCRLRGDGVEFFRRRRKCSRCRLYVDVGVVKQGTSIPLYCSCIKDIFHLTRCNMPSCFSVEQQGYLMVVTGLYSLTCMYCEARGSEMRAISGEGMLFFLCHSHSFEGLMERYDFLASKGWRNIYIYDELPLSRYRSSLRPIGDATVVGGQLVLSRG